MLYVVNRSIAQNVQVRIFAIFGFAVLTAIAAQISIPREPVPITFQVLLVLLAGLVLGARDGALSQVAYLMGIAANLPIAANGMGSAAFAGPTAGYLYAFPIAAAIVGFLAINDSIWLRWMAGLVAVAVIYAIGGAYLKSYLNLSWKAAWTAGVAPFIVIDILKALLAATLGESGRAFLWYRHRDSV